MSAKRSGALQLLSIVISIGVVVLLLQIDSLVHERFYEFGLEFDVAWANDYWFLLRACLGLLGIVIVLNIGLLLWRSSLKPNMIVRFKHSIVSLKSNIGPWLRASRPMFDRLVGNKFSLFGLTMIGFLGVIALFAPFLAPPKHSGDPYVFFREGASYVTPPPTPPSSGHPFGTVAGYDIYYGCVWGTRLAFRISLPATLLAVCVGLVFGGVSGYFGGLTDEVLMRFTDIFFGLPSLLLAMVLIVAVPSELPIVLGPLNFNISLSTWNKIILIFALTGWPTFARLFRGEVMKTKNEDYVEAAKAIGASDFRIIVRHILPNAVFPLLALASLSIGGVILGTATLSFLNVLPMQQLSNIYGQGAAYADWAMFITRSRDWIVTAEGSFTHAYAFVIPGAFLTTFILGWTLIGNTMRALLDPTTRRR